MLAAGQQGKAASEQPANLLAKTSLAKAEAETKKAKKDKKDYMWLDLRGETRVKAPGEVDGEGFVIDGCEDCVLRIEDHTDQVFIDYCRNSEIFLGAASGSVFLRNCDNCTVSAFCAQLRTRECTKCDLYLGLPSNSCPSIERSTEMRFGELN